MTDTTYKLPRTYINQPFQENASIDLCEAHAHYLHTVMRRKDGDKIRVFNAQDGEWLGALENLKKKSGRLTLTRHLRPQPKPGPALHLFFAPIAKSRMDWMIEKAVELGVTDLHPVLTQNTEVRTVKPDRLNAQITEAAEQAERLTLPALHPLKEMTAALEHVDMTVLACLERFDAPPIQKTVKPGADTAILIGPVGGFTEKEKRTLAAKKQITPVSLGENVLRCETAAIKALILAAGC